MSGPSEFNNLSVFAGFELYTPLAKDLVLATRAKGKTNLIRNRVSFANNTALGWNQRDLVSGFELYVDNQHLVPLWEALMKA